MFKNWGSGSRDNAEEYSDMVQKYHLYMDQFLQTNSSPKLAELEAAHKKCRDNLCRQFKHLQDDRIKEILELNFKHYKNQIYMNLNWDGIADDVAIGIDLGTVNSVSAVYFQDKLVLIKSKEGEPYTPSYVAFSDKETSVGKFCKDLQVKNPSTTVHDVKRLIGRHDLSDIKLKMVMKNWQFNVVETRGKPNISINGTLYAPEDISAILLKEFKRVAEEQLQVRVRKAVITVPAYFDDNQRKATIAAGTAAGLEVLTILNEPTAAAIAYKFNRYNLQAKNILIFDLGGGTFDVAILQTAIDIHVSAVGGNTYLGGNDFDAKLMNHCIEQFEITCCSIGNALDGHDILSRKRKIRLLKACEEAKKRLSSVKTAPVYVESFFNDRDLDVEISRQKFEDIIHNDLTEMMKIVKRVMDEAKLNVAEIEDIVLVGGSTRIPKLQKMLSDIFPRAKLNTSIDVDLAVAFGAAMHAAILNGNQKAKELQNFRSIQDVTPMSFGIEAVNDGIKGRYSIVIPKNSPYPTANSMEFQTSEDYQTEADIRCYQGESKIARENILLGEFRLQGIPSDPAGQQKIQVSMEITQMGILDVTAKCKSTGTYETRQLKVTKMN